MSYLVKGETGDWEVVIGLEVHAQIISQSKLFSSASATFGGLPNSQVSFVDAGMPGMLPVLNGYCVEQAVRTGLGINAVVNLHSVFERKNYFYPDLPSGYQISQYQKPIVGEGWIDIDLADGSSKRIGIERLHMEQDAGKSLHDQHPTNTYVDLNRAGVALMEIVSRPDLSSPDEVSAYLRKLRAILRYLGSCDGNMEEGSMRADVNLSVRRSGEPLGTRCEIKNVNSIRFIQQAIEYEGARQVALIEQGGKVIQQTRLWDTKQGKTRAMRSKEEAHDYRYFPDPDLLPLQLTAEYVEKIRASLPELPDAKKKRLMAEAGLTAYDASVLVAEKERADWFEVAAKGRDGKLVANWLITELLGGLNKMEKDLSESPISPQALGKLVGLISDGTLSGKLAKDVFAVMLETGRDPEEIVAEKGLKQVTDAGAITEMVAGVLAANADKVAEYRSGKDKLFGFFVGLVMKASQGKANPALLNEELKKQLNG
ncbi:MAG: Asp-tRNA(Asn)/Glu-tRNA(Gln) amidotransferase subunit GatB [Alphaproteobacteria bacterium]